MRHTHIGPLSLVFDRDGRVNVAADIFDHGVSVYVITDLTRPGAAQDIYEEVKQAGVQVEYLINKAGFGDRGKFHEQD